MIPDSSLRRRAGPARLVLAGLLLSALLAPAPAAARGSHGRSWGSRSYSGRSYRSSPHASHSFYRSSRASSSHSTYRAPRSWSTGSSHGRTHRSAAAKREFMRHTGYPHGRPGYVVDHVVPLARGGADSPSNMQWQTRQEAKAKDRWELGPRTTRHPRSHNTGRHRHR